MLTAAAQPLSIYLSIYLSIFSFLLLPVCARVSVWGNYVPGTFRDAEYWRDKYIWTAVLPRQQTCSQNLTPACFFPGRSVYGDGD